MNGELETCLVYGKKIAAYLYQAFSWFDKGMDR
jgi:hypothetical protein